MPPVSESSGLDVPIVFVLGGPGSGKGTQCDMIVKKYGFTHLSSGDLLRDEVASGSQMGKSLEGVMARGELVPLELVLQLMNNAINQHKNYSRGFLIDGYPREMLQGTRFEEEVAPCSFVLSFDVSDAVMTQRLLHRGQTSGRVDDNEETIKKRLQTFHSVSMPVIQHYESQGKLRKVVADGSAADVFKKVDDVFKAEKITPCPNCLKSSMIMFVVGGPGSGKGTQCEMLAKKYGFTHLSSGDLLREEVNSGSERGQELTEIMKRGELVPNETVMALLKEAMIERIATSRGFLIDGYPRELGQGIAFEQDIAPVRFMLYFNLSDEIMTQRLLARAETSGRADDNEETIKKRLATYHNITTKVVSYYQNIGKVQEVSSEDPKDVVFEKVCAIMDKAIDEDKMLKEAKVIFVVGGPGSGKGTQCANIVKDYGFWHLSSGDLLRQEVSSGSVRGERLQATMKRGDLVSMDEVMGLLRDAMLKAMPETKCFLIDGYPRQIDQGTRFEYEIVKCNSVLFFDVTDKTMTERLLARGKTSGRSDDNAETIKKRLATFHSQTKPVVEYYKQRGKITTISAEKSPEEVYQEVKIFMDGKSGPKSWPKSPKVE